MKPTLCDADLRLVGDVIRQRLGLDYPAARRDELAAALAVVATDLGLDGVAETCRRITGSPLTDVELGALARALTVGETNFYRDSEVFAALEKQILPELIERRRGGDRRIRVWSAACCTGEEPYTVAMILHRLLPDLGDWDVTVLATDVNTEFLRRARRGVYGKRSFRRAPGWLQRRHFSVTADGLLEIDPVIREMVTFAFGNLVEPDLSAAGARAAMDVVLCRNVLIYFDAANARKVVEGLRACLAPGGWLALGRCERAASQTEDLQLVRLRGEFWYRNASPAADATSRLPAPPPPPPPPPPALSPAAQVHFAHGDYAAAATELAHFLEKAPPGALDRRRAAALLAQACANLGRLDEAQRWCEEALASNSFDAPMHYLLASVLLERGHDAQAETCLRRAIVADDRFVLAHFALGNLARRRGAPRRAREHFERTLALLRFYEADENLPAADGLSAGRLLEIARQALGDC